MSSSPFDPKVTAVWTIRLEDDVSNRDRPHFASIRYNHRPKVSPEEDIQVNVNKTSGESHLKLGNQRSSFSYKGRYANADEGAYVLIVSGDGREKELVLRKLDASHVYNLTSDGSGADAEELFKRYPQLTLADEDEDDLFGESDDDADLPIDNDNPFDYRHYLNANTDIDELESKGPKENNAASNTTKTPKPTTRPQAATVPAKATTNSTNATPTSTPTLKPSGSKNTSIFSTKRKQPKAPATTKTNAKRVKAGSDDEPRSAPTSMPASTAPEPIPKPTLPKVRLDRKASVRPVPDDDEGELILENETPTTANPYQHKKAMSLALSGQLGSGPISLRSAANSPAGRLASASPLQSRGDGGGDEGLGIDLEGSISPDELSAARGSIRSSAQRGSRLSSHVPHSQNVGHRGDEDEDQDAEFDEDDGDNDLARADGLESPVLTNDLVPNGNHKATNLHTNFPAATGADDGVVLSSALGDDNLEEALERALAGDFEDLASPMLHNERPNESDEESEEE